MGREERSWKTNVHVGKVNLGGGDGRRNDRGGGDAGSGDGGDGDGGRGGRGGRKSYRTCVSRYEKE